MWNLPSNNNVIIDTEWLNLNFSTQKPYQEEYLALCRTAKP